MNHRFAGSHLIARGKVRPFARGYLSGTALLYVLALAGYPASAVLRVYIGLDLGITTFSYTFRAIILTVALYVIIRTGFRRGFSPSPFAVFWALYIGRIFHDTIVSPYTSAAMPVNYLAYSIGITLIPAIAFFAVPDAKSLKIALYGNLLLCLIVCVTAMLMPQTRTFLENNGRVGLETLNPISFGHVGGTLILLSAYVLLVERGRFEALRVILACLSLSVGLYTVLGAGSRGPALALGVSLLILLWWTFVHLKWKGAKKLAFTCAILTVVSISFASQLDLIDVGQMMIVERTETDVSTIDSYSRIILIRDAFAEFLEHPFLGSSVVENTGDYPHNLIVEAFMATGLLGGLAFLMVLSNAFAASLRILRLHHNAVWVVLIFVQYFVGGLFSGSLWGSSQYWCFAVAVLAIGNERVWNRVRVAVKHPAHGHLTPRCSRHLTALGIGPGQRVSIGRC